MIGMPDAMVRMPEAKRVPSCEPVRLSDLSCYLLVPFSCGSFGVPCPYPLPSTRSCRVDQATAVSVGRDDLDEIVVEHGPVAHVGLALGRRVVGVAAVERELA